tara:strand:- start:3144 stop:3830 length:687 start_codon:yes stop_codon:yes gene_type:complete
MSLSIIIPCYNEKLTIESILTRVRNCQPDAELIVIDDASTDGSKEWLQNHTTIFNFHLICHSKNQGKGAALQSAFPLATQDIIIIQDADLEYDPHHYPQLIKPIQDNRCDVVYGSRFLTKQTPSSSYLLAYLANKFLTQLTNLVTPLQLTDMETCYKVFRREVIQSLHLKETGFGIEPEITVKLAKQSYQILDIAITYNPRRYHDGKKIGIADFFWAIWCIFRYRFLN